MWLALGVLCGQAAAPWSAPWGVVAAAGAVGLRCRMRRPALTLLAVALVGWAVGEAQVEGRLRPQLPAHHIARRAGGVVEVRAAVVDRPSRQGVRARLLIAVQAVRRGGAWQPGTGRVLVTVYQAERRWRRGDRLQGQLRLRRPRNFGNPGEFDYEAYLARRGVYVTGAWASDAGWRRRPAARAGLRAGLDAWRDAVSRLIEQTLEGPARPIVAALLIGETGGLGAEVRERYARTGLSHVLAISGLHVGLVAGAAYTAVRWLLARSEWLLLRAAVPKLSIALAGVPVLLYAGIAGGSVPTVRAVVMVCLLMLATVVNRQRDWLATLAAAALVTSLVWPGSVFEISFQLSFVAVLAIVLGMRRVTGWWNAWEEARLVRLRGPIWRRVRWLVLYQAVTVCAVAGTAPLTAWHFNRISWIALVANPIVVPLLGLLPVSVGLLAAMAVPFSPGLAAALLSVAGAAVTVADGLVAGFAALPGAAARVATPSILELALAYGGLAALLIENRARRRLLLAAVAVLLGADAGYWYGQRFHRGALRVTFLSVGQGDSTVIEFPGSAVMVIDGGGLSASFDVGERVVGPYLWRRKVGHVDYVVLTHPQFDHFGGLSFLVRAFAPDEFWWNGARGDGARIGELWRTVGAQGLPAIVVGRGFRRVIGGVEVLALSPDPSATGSANNRSLTLRLRYGPTTLLFPGDLEAEGERRLVRTVPGALRSTVLKVPHHGSRTSSTAAFLTAVAPRVAVVSAGHLNRFGLPHGEVLAAYRRRGAEVWRTDRDGAIMLHITARGDIAIRRGRVTP